MASARGRAIRRLRSWSTVSAMRVPIDATARSRPAARPDRRAPVVAHRSSTGSWTVTEAAIQIPHPVVHQPTAALEQVGARVGRLGLVAHHVRQRRLDHLPRVVRPLRRPIPEAGPEAVRHGRDAACLTSSDSMALCSALPRRLGNTIAVGAAAVESARSRRASSRISTARLHSGTRCSRPPSSAQPAPSTPARPSPSPPTSPAVPRRTAPRSAPGTRRPASAPPRPRMRRLLQSRRPPRRAEAPVGAASQRDVSAAPP